MRRHRARLKGHETKPSLLGATELDSWKSVVARQILNQRVHGDRSQLSQMMAVQNLLDTRIRDNVTILLEPDRGPRLKVAGRNLSLTVLSEEWSRRRLRTVVLGEPGAGKTVVALVLVAAVIERSKDESDPIAELFPLAEWSRWEAEHPSNPFSHWLAYQLATTYQLPTAVCDELIDRGLVIPVLDGLDEVPERSREDCRRAIDAYSTELVPPRPFLITSRAAEYIKLDPHWVASDQLVVVQSLETAQVLAALAAEGRNSGGWLNIHDALASGNTNLRTLFHNPLRLTIALKSYAEADPSELLDLTLDEAKARLWDLFLATGYEPKANYLPNDAYRWLRWLAAQMTRQDRQIFWIHELYRYAPRRPKEFRRFRTVLGQLTIGLICASVLLAALVLDAEGGDLLRVIGTLLTIHVIGELVFRRTGLPIARRALSLASPEEPVERLIISWRLNFRSGRRAMTVNTIGLFACWWAYGGAVAAGLRGAIIGLPIGATMATLTKLIIPASAVVALGSEETVLVQRDILKGSRQV